MSLVVTKLCERCGIEMRDVSCRQKFCLDCAILRHNQAQCRYHAKRGATPRPETSARKQNAFDSAAKEMVALGFGSNYAAYQAYKRKEGQTK